MSAAAFSAFELQPGAFYQVTTSFEDYDGRLHPAGDSWEYLSRDFFPYEAGLTLHIRRGGMAAVIRLQDYPEAQGGIISSFHACVRLLA